MEHTIHRPSDACNEPVISANPRDNLRRRDPYIITRNGAMKAVLLDAGSYENILEPLNLLKVIALANMEIKAGRTKRVSEVVTQLRDQIGRR
jgi:PHD/YefM family antitoxin component YafN of YafNO toxin-antitoxin module